MSTVLERQPEVSRRRVTLRNLGGFIRRYRNWREVCRKFRNHEAIDRIRLWNGLEFRAANTTGALLLNVYNEVWDRDVYRMARAGGPFAIGRRDTVVDLGANIGLFTIRAARLAPQGRVLAVEPDPENYLLLTTHVSQAGIRNVTTQMVAVGKEAGTGCLRRDSFGTHTLTEHLWFGPGQVRGAGEGLVVQCLPLAELLDRHRLARVDLLKMDIEGSEWDVVESTPTSVWSRVARVALEYHEVTRPGVARLIRDRLEALGYQVDTDATAEPQGVGLLFARRS